MKDLYNKIKDYIDEIESCEHPFTFSTNGAHTLYGAESELYYCKDCSMIGFVKEDDPDTVIWQYSNHLRDIIPLLKTLINRHFSNMEAKEQPNE